MKTQSVQPWHRAQGKGHWMREKDVHALQVSGNVYLRITVSLAAARIGLLLFGPGPTWKVWRCEFEQETFKCTFSSPDKMGQEEGQTKKMRQKKGQKSYTMTYESLMYKSDTKYKWNSRGPKVGPKLKHKSASLAVSSLITCSVGGAKKNIKMATKLNRQLQVYFVLYFFVSLFAV